MKKNAVFIYSLILSCGTALWAVLENKSFSVFSNMLFNFLTVNFAWLYLLAMLIFVVFVIYIACSKYGNLRL